MYNKDSYCSFCGTKFTEQINWPRKCFICYNDSYKNPIPVVVAIVPVCRYTIPNPMDPNPFQNVLIEKRNIEPQKGGWAYPSGYIDFGETWQQAIVRELQEEVGLFTKEEDFTLFDVVNSISGNMLIFCLHKGIHEDDIKFILNDEVSEIDLPNISSSFDKYQFLCFPTHNDMWKKFQSKKL